MWLGVLSALGVEGQSVHQDIATDEGGTTNENCFDLALQATHEKP